MDVVEYISVLIRVNKNVECDRTKATIQYILVEVATPHEIALILWSLTNPPNGISIQPYLSSI